MSRREYDDATKAAVMAALLEGQSVRAVADKYHVPRATVGDWAKTKGEWVEVSGDVSLTVRQPDVLSDAKSEEPYAAGRDIGLLIVDLLRTELAALKRIAEAAADPAWISKQNAADLAVFAGVMQDKVFKKLDALTNAAANNAAQD
jgi:hypothetical protein